MVLKFSSYLDNNLYIGNNEGVENMGSAMVWE